MIRFGTNIQMLITSQRDYEVVDLDHDSFPSLIDSESNLREDIKVTNIKIAK